MNKSYNFNNYNLNRVLTAKELAELSKTYKDNLETIIVMMNKKAKTPQQPPQWFLDYMKNFKKEIIEEVITIIDQKMDQKFEDFAKLNNLKTK